jgi:hypothetical protein
MVDGRCLNRGVERFFGAPLVVPRFGPILFAAAKANPVFGRAVLSLGALALLAVFVEIDNRILGHRDRLQRVGNRRTVAA